MSNRSKDRSHLCAFTFADGRQCRMPRRDDHPYLCPFHARKESQALAGQRAAKDIAYHLSGTYLSACDLSSALGRLFSAVAQGHIKPKTASTLAYLGQTMVQALHMAQPEYINAFGTNSWRETLRECIDQSLDYRFPPQSESESDPKPQPACGLDPAEKAIAEEETEAELTEQAVKEGRGEPELTPAE